MHDYILVFHGGRTQCGFVGWGAKQATRGFVRFGIRISIPVEESDSDDGGDDE